MGLRGTANKRKLNEMDGAGQQTLLLQSPVIPPPQMTPPSTNKVLRTEDWVSDATTTNGGVGDLSHTPQQVQVQQQQQASPYLGPGRSYQCYPGVSGGEEYHHRSCYEVQQTIRCDENGKSYLDLGSWNSRNSVGRCCEGRTSSWCSRGPSCYRQKRLAVLNISMCKLGRYRQFSDPSLHRSVLICNTLRLIEREMEQEGCFGNSSSSSSSSSSATSSQHSSVPPEASSHHQQFPEVPVPYEPPRVPTPFPPAVSSDNASPLDDERSINWGSVLSLSSQSDLDPLNNNDCLGDSDLSHDLDDFLPAWKVADDSLMRQVAPPRASDSGELENIMHVLVGT